MVTLMLLASSLLAEQNKQQNTGKATSIKLLLLMNKTNFFIVLQSACIVYAVNLYSLMYGTCTHSTIVTMQAYSTTVNCFLWGFMNMLV